MNESPRHRVLLIEDNRGDAVLLREMLATDASGVVELTWADRLGKAVEALRLHAFDAILLDLTLPDAHGLTTVERVLAVAGGTPIIVLTGVRDEALAKQALRQGAQDYLVKGSVDGRGVVRAVQYAINRKQAEEALRESESRYRSLFSSMNEGFALHEVILDSEGMPADYRFLDANPAFERLTGLARERVIGRTISEVMGEDRHAFMARLAQVGQSGSPCSFEDFSGRFGKWYRVHAYRPAAGQVAMVLVDTTEVRQAQDRERRALETVVAARAAMTMIEAMREGVALVAMDGTVASVNPSFERLGGYGREEVVGRRLSDVLFEVLAPEDMPIASEALTRALRGEGMEMGTVTIFTKQGVRVPVVPSISFIRDAIGAATAIVLTTRDISDLQAAQDALQRSHALLERVFDNTYLLLAYLDTDLNVIRANTPFAQLLGCSAASLSGRRLLDVWPSWPSLNVLRRAARSGEPYMAEEAPFVLHGGEGDETRYWDWSVQPLRDKSGQVDGLVLCMLNVTKRRQAQQALAESERKYRELVENANSIIMRRRVDGTVTFFNEYAQRFFGYSEAQILGRNVLDTIVPPRESTGRDLAALIRAIGADPDEHASNENENVLSNGQRVWVHWSNRAIRDASGQVVEVLCVGSDVTARRRADDQMRRYQTRLRGLSERLAETEERERRRISAQIHDTVIQSLSLANIKLGGLRQDLTSDNLAERAARVDIVRSTLSDAIRECRSLMAELTPPLLYELGLRPALQDLVQVMHSRHGVPIRLDATDAPLSLDAAAQAVLFHSARELLMNALKHAQAKEIVVSMSHDAGRARIAVRDNGVGFEPDRRTGTTFSEKGGFGLFNVRERLEALRATLEIHSMPGDGTTAVITVPLAETAASPVDEGR